MSITTVDDVIKSFEKNLEKEESELGKDILRILIENAHIAKESHTPLCQDTGMAVFFVEVGQEVIIKGHTLTEAINKGVSEGYTDGYLRKSVVSPITRINTKDNTPAIIHYEMVKGDKVMVLSASICMSSGRILADTLASMLSIRKSVSCKDGA